MIHLIFVEALSSNFPKNEAHTLILSHERSSIHYIFLFYSYTSTCGEFYDLNIFFYIINMNPQVRNLAVNVKLMQRGLKVTQIKENGLDKLTSDRGRTRIK